MPDDAVNIIKKSFDENTNSHAFLCVTNNISLALKDVKDIIKYINCNKKKNNCDCNICNMIEKGTNPDVIFISTDAKEIKKDEVSTIMSTFSSSPLVNKYSVYVINNAEKLNSSAANSILKFLEEPTGNVIGFFITDNPNAVLPTIKSRLNIVNFNYKSDNILSFLNISEDEFQKYYQDSVKLINLLNKKETYKKMKESKNYSKKERNEIVNILKIVKQIYIVKFEYLSDNYEENYDVLNELLSYIETNDINLVVKRIKVLDNIITDFNYNVNKDLFINKLFISWE